MIYLKVFPDKTIRKKNSWNWACALSKKGKENILYTAQGYDTKASALKQAKSHNNKLIKKLVIKLYDHKGNYQCG